MTTSSTPRQPSKDASPIICTPSATVILPSFPAGHRIRLLGAASSPFLYRIPSKEIYTPLFLSTIISVTLLQLEKASSAMPVMSCGIVTLPCFPAGQNCSMRPRYSIPSRTLNSLFASFTVISAKFVQSLNTSAIEDSSSPIDAMLFGIAIPVIPPQPINAEASIY